MGEQSTMTAKHSPRVRSTCFWVVSCAVSLAGCQSMTRQQQAWNVPPSELFEQTPKLDAADNKWPPLPGSAPVAAAPVPATVPKVFSVDQPPKVVAPKRDDALVQTSIQVPQKPELPKLSVPPAPAPIDPETTRGIVTGLMGASSTLSTVDIDTDDDDETKAKQPPVDPQVIATATSVPDLKPPQPIIKTSLPPIETLPQQNLEGPEQRSATLQIPKAAICRAVQGRGNFTAMPPEKIVPGSALLVYWELDGLTRRKVDQNAHLSATLELVRADRDQILGSVRETLEKSGDLPSGGDFAAMRWQIPADLAPGDYRIRITTVDLNGKSTDQTDVDMTVMPGQTSAAAE